MEKFIRIESVLLNVNTVADIHPNVFNDTECIIINTNDGTKYIKPLPKHIDTIDDVAGAYLDLITSFLASKEPDELVLNLNEYDLAE